MTISRRTLFALSGLSTLAACSSPKQAASPNDTGSPQQQQETQPESITVGLTYIPNVQFCAFYLGVQEKLFGDLDVRLRHHGEQEGLFEAVQLGREDIVFASADEAVIAGGLSVVSTAYQQYPAEVMFAGDASSLTDLAGKTLGIPGRFGSSYYAALVALQTAGLSEQEVELVEIGYTAVAALSTKKVDAIVGFRNNELVQFTQQGIAVTSLPISPEPTLVGPSLITTTQRAEESWVQQINNGMLEAERIALQDPAAALDATAKEVPALAEKAQRENAQRVLEATAELWKDDAGQLSVAVDEAAITRMTAFLKEAGIMQ